MIFYLFIDEAIDMEIVNERAKQMPFPRYQNYLNYYDDKDKINNFLSYMIIRKYFDNQSVEIGNLVFSQTELKKPFIKNSSVKFNISHSNNLIAVAFDRNEIGVDVERIKDFNNDIIDSILSDIEKKEYSKEIHKNDFLTKIWTVKESYTKMLGLGLSVDFDKISFSLDKDPIFYDNNYIKSYKIRDYWLSVCSKEQNPKLIEISIVDLLE